MIRDYGVVEIKKIEAKADGKTVFDFDSNEFVIDPQPRLVSLDLIDEFSVIKNCINQKIIDVVLDNGFEEIESEQEGWLSFRRKRNGEEK